MFNLTKQKFEIHFLHLDVRSSPLQNVVLIGSLSNINFHHLDIIKGQKKSYFFYMNYIFCIFFLHWTKVPTVFFSTDTLMLNNSWQKKKKKKCFVTPCLETWCRDPVAAQTPHGPRIVKSEAASHFQLYRRTSMLTRSRQILDNYCQQRQDVCTAHSHLSAEERPAALWQRGEDTAAWEKVWLLEALVNRQGGVLLCQWMFTCFCGLL